MRLYQRASFICSGCHCKRRRRREVERENGGSHRSPANDQSRGFVRFPSQSFLQSRPHPFWFSLFPYSFHSVYYVFEQGFDSVFLATAIKISKEAINGMEIEYVDIAPLPMLNTDLEVDGTYPPAVEAFRRKILEADSILFASPEYNYSVTGTASSASSSFYFFFLALCSVWSLRNGWKREENCYRF